MCSSGQFYLSAMHNSNVLIPPETTSPCSSVPSNEGTYPTQSLESTATQDSQCNAHRQLAKQLLLPKCWREAQGWQRARYPTVYPVGQFFNRI